MKLSKNQESCRISGRTKSSHLKLKKADSTYLFIFTPEIVKKIKISKW